MVNLQNPNTLEFDDIDPEVLQLLLAVARNGSLDSADVPVRTLQTALSRLSESPTNITSDWHLLDNLDQSEVEALEDKWTFDLTSIEPHKALEDMNVVAVDGSSMVIVDNQHASVYARGGSYGFSQKKIHRLSFLSGVNKVWCDVAINVEASRGVVQDIEERQHCLDKLADDNNYPYYDRVTLAEVEALALVEAASIILCCNEFVDNVDLILHDGPLFVSRGGYNASLQRLRHMHMLNIPSINVVKTPAASPVLHAAGISDSTDGAFFDRLEPGHRSSFFLQQMEASKLRIPTPLTRALAYFKSLNGKFLFRWEVPLWVLQQFGPEKVAEWIAADSFMDKTGVSFSISRADSLVRIRSNLRTLMRETQRVQLQERGLKFTQNFNQTRWPWS
ncbi:MAG: DNA double-strand break repair nuclease NurA [Candidatus Hermodarchaeota archaeon]